MELKQTESRLESAAATTFYAAGHVCPPMGGDYDSGADGTEGLAAQFDEKKVILHNNKR